MSENGTHIRIKDIAARAGCSIGTVDRVIHNRGKVSESVKKRILEIISELDYKPNVNARVLASKHPLNLGILLPAYNEGEYWELPTAGIQHALDRYDEQGYQINVFRLSYHNPEQFYKAGMQMLAENMDGIIMSPATYKESVRLVRSYFQEDKPFILIDSDIQGLPSLSFIGKDPIQSGSTVAILIRFVPKMMALGGVAVGSIKAREEASVAGIISRSGLLTLLMARLANMGSNIWVEATLEVSSVRNDIRATTASRIRYGWTPFVQSSCSPNQMARPED